MASPVQNTLASWFNSVDVSDCDIRVMTTAALAAKERNKPPNVDSNLQCNKETASGQRHHRGGPPKGNDMKVYPSHKVVLKSSSAFFLARITEPWQPSATYEMTVESEEDMPAAELVIKYMYTKDLVCDLPLEQLLRIMSIADQFQVYHLSDICAQRINARLAVASPCWEDVLLMLRWSHPFLKERLKPGRTAALGAVLKRFLDLEKSWANGNERAQFLQLPFQAVAWLLEHPTLKVASENTVAVAIDAWLAGSDLASQCSNSEEEQLWRYIRGGSLGGHFLSYRLPTLPTFCNLPGCTEILSDITRAKTIPSGVLGPKLDDLRTSDVFKAKRPASDRTFASLNLALTVQELTAAFNKVKTPPTIGTVFTSETQYFAGYFWRAELKVDAGGKYDENHKHHVGVAVHADETGTEPGHHGALCFSLSRLGQDTNCTKYQYQTDVLRKLNDRPWGWYGAMGADWQALAQDGVVHLGFKCTALD